MPSQALLLWHIYNFELKGLEKQQIWEVLYALFLFPPEADHKFSHRKDAFWHLYQE